MSLRARVERGLVTTFVMLAAIMNMIDTTIAAVALPHMQGTTSASREEITWVLSSYIIALAIAIPLASPLCAAFGRKRVLLGSVFGFTVFSVLCGVSTTLEELVLFRFLQGMAGAALVPLGQAVLLDIYPAEEHGFAMAIFGLAGITGPIVGPVLGGWLTANFHWGWVFLVNAPGGIISFVGLLIMMRDDRGTGQAGFDWQSFALLAVGIGMFQLMLDRGNMHDWFESAEIRIEAGLSALAFFGFAACSLLRPKPFFTPALLHDRNFIVGNALGFVVGVLSLSTTALLPDMLTGLMGYPPLQVGMVMAPRGIGTLLCMPMVGRLQKVIDPRWIILIGFLLYGATGALIALISPDADSALLYWSGLVQGFASNMTFVPLAMLMFQSIPIELRNEAAGLSTLIRYVGSAAGVSVLQAFAIRNAVVSHEDLASMLRPANVLQALGRTGEGMLSEQSLAVLNAEVTRQAGMIAYIDCFWLVFWIGVLAGPLVLLLQYRRQGTRLA